MSTHSGATSPQPGKHKPDYKIVILGQKDVGKTSLIFRYIYHILPRFAILILFLVALVEKTRPDTRPYQSRTLGRGIDGS